MFYKLLKEDPINFLVKRYYDDKHNKNGKGG